MNERRTGPSPPGSRCCAGPGPERCRWARLSTDAAQPPGSGSASGRPSKPPTRAEARESRADPASAPGSRGKCHPRIETQRIPVPRGCIGPAPTPGRPGRWPAAANAHVQSHRLQAVGQEGEQRHTPQPPSRRWLLATPRLPCPSPFPTAGYQQRGHWGRQKQFWPGDTRPRCCTPSRNLPPRSESTVQSASRNTHFKSEPQAPVPARNAETTVSRCCTRLLNRLARIQPAAPDCLGAGRRQRQGRRNVRCRTNGHINTSKALGADEPDAPVVQVPNQGPGEAHGEVGSHNQDEDWHGRRRLGHGNGNAGQVSVGR